MRHPNQSIYEERLSRFREKQSSLKRSINLFGWVRLIVFGVIAYVIIGIIFPMKSPILFMSSIFIGVMIFVLPLYYHQKLKAEFDFLGMLIRINEFEISKAEKLYSDGSELHIHSNLALDIDLVGSGSLFELMNRCVTKQGKQKLLQTLISNTPNAGFITRRQQSISELTSLIDFRQESIAIAFEGKSELQKQKTFEATQYYLNKSFWKVMVMVWPFISITALVMGFYWNPVCFIIPIIGSAIVGFNDKPIQKLYREISGDAEQWKSYSKQFAHFHKNDFKGEELIDLNKTTTGAHHALRQLGKLSSQWDQRANAFAAGFMNALMLFDIKCAIEFEQWKQEHNQQLLTWIEAIGQIECLNAQATFAFNHPHYHYPTLSEKKLFIDITKMGHPLIADDNVITNDIQLGHDGKVYLITGSNMSGKSTFLRGVGMNMILAQAGLPVFAESMTFSPMLVLTSFRQSDSIQESTSYFMAELKRLKEIIESVDHELGSLVLLDEILRGTNSEDKSHGSEVLLEKLISKNAITILATHDLKLGELESKHAGQVANYCFESIINGDDLIFDYKIKRGIAQNKNATFLMKKMGIV